MKRVHANVHGMARINSLPDDALVCILSDIDTKYAVQSACVSKRWNDLWKLTPCLNFNSDSFESLMGFDRFVNHVLSKRGSAPLKTFIYKCTSDGDWNPFLFKKVIRYVTSLNVEEVRINLLLTHGQSAQAHIPMMLLTCKSLKKLELKGICAANFTSENENQTSYLEHLDILKFSTWAHLFDKNLSKPFGLTFTTLTNMHLNNVRLRYTQTDASPFKECLHLKILHLSQSSIGINLPNPALVPPPRFMISPPRLNSLRLTSNQFGCEVQIVAPVTNLIYLFNAKFGWCSVNFPSSTKGLIVKIRENKPEEESFRHTFVKLTRRQESPNIEMSYRRIEVSRLDAAWKDPASLAYTGLVSLTIGEGSMITRLLGN